MFCGRSPTRGIVAIMSSGWNELPDTIGPRARLLESPPWGDLVALLIDAGSDTDAAIRTALAAEPGGAHFVILQGRRCRTWPALLDQWGAALEFPHYYGRNRDAFNECLGDLLEIDVAGLGHAFGDRAGRPAGLLVVHLMDAPQMLADEDPGELAGFLGQLAFCSDGTRIANISEPPRLARLQVLLGVDTAGAEALRLAVTPGPGHPGRGWNG